MKNENYYSAEEIAVHLTEKFGTSITPTLVARAASYLGVSFKENVLPFTNCRIKITQKLYPAKDIQRITHEIEPVAVAQIAKEKIKKQLVKKTPGFSCLDVKKR